VSAWLGTPEPRPDASLRLLCLPYAGGSSATFATWPSRLPEAVEMLTAELPARGSRLNDPAVCDAGEIARILAAELDADTPLALYGHSMGGLLAFELAQLVRPVVLLVSGRRPPHLPEPYDEIRHLPDDEFVTVLRHRYGRIGALLDRPDVRDAFLPSLRGDFTLCEEYAPSTEAPLDCPLLVYGGMADRDATLDELREWQRYTTGLFSVATLSGGHFFIEDHADAFLRRLSVDLDALLQRSKSEALTGRPKCQP
jgi:medium-chain acyl-[acyl-carrier-protein] hydrolase